MGPDPLPPPLGGAKGGKQSGRADIERTAEGEQGPPGRGPTAGLYSRYGYTAGIEGPHREIRDRFGERTGDSIQALGIGGRRLVPGMTRSAVTLLLFSLFSALHPSLPSLHAPPGSGPLTPLPGGGIGVGSALRGVHRDFRAVWNRMPRATPRPLSAKHIDDYCLLLLPTTAPTDPWDDHPPAMMLPGLLPGRRARRQEPSLHERIPDAARAKSPGRQ